MSAEHPVVFVSYAHADNEAEERDRRWLDRLRVHLEPLRQQVDLAVFSDKDLEVGDLWHNEIQGKLRAVCAAVLMVSPAFLASTYIRNWEMPILLRRWEEEGVAILPLFVKPCAFEEVKFRYPHPEDGPAERSLADFQAFNSPDDSLLDMDEAKQERTLAAVVTRLREIVCPGSSPAPSPTPIERAAPLVLTHRLPPSGPDLFGRSGELRRLSRAWNDLHTHVITLVAFGGVGKTALVNHWLARIAKDDYRGARRVYGWSAYSQGSKERVTSADQFIDEALRFFGDDREPGESIEARAVRLAELVRRQRTLLVLDGIESLQYPPGPGEGHIKDPGLRTLVSTLAAQNPGLCVITTRARVTDLAHLESTTCPRVDLEQLDPPDGARLLASLGVQGPEDELRAGSEAFGGHALALTLLGTFLRDACGGDVRRSGEIGPLAHQIEHGGHARRVMDSYETWLGDGPERQVLRMLGLFDRPAEPGALRALRREPPILGVTDRIAGLDERGWRDALVRLRHARLVLEPDECDPQALDAHPLVREHFGEKLREEDEAAWRAGHDRLFEYYRGEGCPKELPDTLEEMAPLFAAVQHGCAAGRHQEALDEVYWTRIKRKEEFYSSRKLGAFGPELAALSGFFDPPWSTPVAALSEADKGFVLNEAGFDLRALGRLAEAVEPMKAGLDADVTLEDWKNAAAQAGNLSEL